MAINLKRQTAGNEKQQMLKKKKEEEEKKKKAQKASKATNVDKNSSYNTSPKGLSTQNKKTTSTRGGSSAVKTETTERTNYLEQNRQKNEERRREQLRTNISKGKVTSTIPKQTLQNKMDANIQKRKSEEDFKKRQAEARIAQKNGTATQAQKNILETKASRVIKGNIEGVAGNVAKFATDKQGLKDTLDNVIDMIPSGALRKGKTLYDLTTGKLVDKGLDELSKTKAGEVARDIRNWGEVTNTRGENKANVAIELADNPIEKKALQLGGTITRSLSSAVAGPAWREVLYADAYESDYKQSKLNGLTEKQARQHAKMSAAVEVATESMAAGRFGPIDISGNGAVNTLFDRPLMDATTNSLKKSILDTAKNMIRTGKEEAVEELAGGIANPVVDWLSWGKEEKGNRIASSLAMVDEYNTQADRSVNSLIAKGYSKADARNIVASQYGEDYIEQTAQTLISQDRLDEDTAYDLANLIANQQIAYLNGDEQTAQKLQKQIANKMYDANPVDIGFNWAETAEAMAMAFASAAVMGGAAAPVVKTQARDIRASLNEQGMAPIDLAKLTVAVDDVDVAARSQAIIDYAKNNKVELSDSQVVDLANALNEQNNKDYSKQIASEKVAYKGMFNSKGEQDKVANGEITANVMADSAQKASDIIETQFADMPEAEKVATINAIVNRVTGRITASDVNAITTNHPEARTVYEMVVGETLESDNAAMKDRLFATNAQIFLDLANKESANTIDKVGGAVAENYFNKMGVSGQTLFMDTFKDKLTIPTLSEYVDAAETVHDYYRSGATGYTTFEEMEALKNPRYDSVNFETRQRAYEAGQWDRSLAEDDSIGVIIEAGQPINKTTGIKSEGVGRVINRSTKDVGMGIFSVMGQVARAQGIDIILEDNVAENGKIIGNVMYLNVDALDKPNGLDKIFAYTYMHETTHWIQANSPSDYAKLKNRIREAIIEKEGEEGLQKRLDKIKGTYSKRVKNFTDEDAMDELVADGAREFLSDKYFVDRLVREQDSGLIRSILSGIRNALRKLRNLLSLNEDDSPITGSLIKELDILKEAEELWINALHTAIQNQADNRIDALARGEMYSINPGYASDVDAWYKSGRDSDTVFTLGSTGDTLQGLGAIENDIYMTGEKINTILDEDHLDMDIETIKRIPEIIDNPVLVLKSKNDRGGAPNTRMVMFGNIKLPTGPVAAILDLRPVEGRIIVDDMQKLISAYPKNTNPKTGETAREFLENSEVMFVNEKRTARLLRTMGFTRPIVLSQSGSIGSIEYNGPTVKLIGVPFDNVVSESGTEKYSITPQQDAQYLDAVNSGDMETAQRMVDEAAISAGYDIGEYRYGHVAPSADIEKKDFRNLEVLQGLADESADTNLFAVANGISVQPEDYFDPVNGARWYMYDFAEGRDAYKYLKKAIDEVKGRMNPDGTIDEMPTIKIYRAVPEDIEDTKLRSGGEWVTPSRMYAESHGGHALDGKYKILEDEVPADELWWDGNSITEWGYDDGTANAYKNTPNNRKLLDPVTYDDNGNIIPLSERFNTENPDIRYSIGTEDDILSQIAEESANMDVNIEDLPYEDRMLEESRQRRANIRDEIKAYGESQRYKQTVLTKDLVLNPKSVHEACLELVKDLMQNSEYVVANGKRGLYNMDVLKFVENAEKKLFNLYKQEKYDEMCDTAFDVAAYLIESIDIVNDEAFTLYKDVRDYFKSQRIYVSDDIKNDFSKGYGAFRRANFNRMRLVDDPSAQTIDRIWGDVIERYGTLFDVDAMNEVEMLENVAQVMDSLKDYKIAYSSEEACGLAKDLTNDLLDIAMDNGESWHSFADKKKAQYNENTRKLKERHREAINKERLKGVKKVQQVKDYYKNKENKRKERQARAESFGDILENYNWLTTRLLKPTDDKHIPEGFKKSLAQLLAQLDLQTERSKALEAKHGVAQKTYKMAELRRRLEEVAKEDDTGVFEYDGYVFELMKALEERLDGKPVDALEYSDLNAVDTILAYIRHGIDNYNKAFSEDIKENIETLAVKSIDRCKEQINKHGRKDERTGAAGRLSNIVNESMVTPIDMFERVGGGLYDGYKALRKGFDKHERNIKYLRENVFNDIIREYESKKKFLNLKMPGSILESWRDDSQLKDFTLENGEMVRMNPAQIMSLRCLYKRQQARDHILGSGIVVTNVDSASNIKKAIGVKKTANKSTLILTHTDVDNITSTLTADQIKLADRLQEVLNTTCAEWGNETSMRMYGYRKFTEKNYFPIKSSDAYLDSNFEAIEITERIRNFGFTKGTVVNANNPIVIDDFFSVVADHMNKMSLYNAFAAPIADFQRIYNFKLRNGEGLQVGSVKSSVENAYGSRTINYINTFMADLNGTTKLRPEGTLDTVIQYLGRYKKAAVGGNIRVGLQQPTAIIRAFDVISPKYFHGGINVKANMREMYEHCPIAEWKSWGNYQVDMARDLEDIMMNRGWNVLDATTMEMYGVLDNVTWSVIWNAVKNEVKATHKNVEVGSDEFWELCNERASEVFDKTQVVDSVFHRSQGMRSKDVAMRTITSFKAEPTRTFNMVRSDFIAAKEMWDDGDKAGAIKRFNKCAVVFVANAAVVSAAAALADALRGKGTDDDDELGFWESWWNNAIENFKDNANLLKNIYFVGDVISLKDGWGTSNMALEGWESLMNNINAWEKFAAGGGKKSAGELLKGTIEALGYLTGVPTKNVMKDTKAIFDALGIVMPSFATDGTDESRKADAKKINIFSKLGVKDGSDLDNLLNHFGINLTDEELKQREFDKKLADIEAATKGMAVSEKDEKIWDMVSDGYTKWLEEGDLDAIENMRQLIIASGGDIAVADKKISTRIKTAYKKTIGINDKIDEQSKLKEYMQSNLGFTDEEISDICYQSETTKKLKAACRLLDHDMAVDAIRQLVAAGMTKADVYKAWDNRNRGDVSRYMTVKSTGQYIWPTNGTITSNFGYRNAPTSGASSYHEGIDIGASMGANVAAADAGRVVFAGYNGGYGYQVVVQHDDGTQTYYSHLSRINTNVGDTVAKSQSIGNVGSTGTSTGPHLDFRVKNANGAFVNPLKYLKSA